jgi:hypothetical protein
MVTVAGVVVFVFGAAVGVLSIWGMIDPEKLIGLVRRVLDRESGIYVAVGSRLLLGVAAVRARFRWVPDLRNLALSDLIARHICPGSAQ